MTLVATTKGQGGDDLANLVGVPIPLKVTGPLAEPSYGVDFEKAVEVVAKSKAKDLVEKQLGGTGGAAGALGGLLGSQSGGDAQSGGTTEEGSEAEAPAQQKSVEDAVKGLKGLFGN